MDRVPELIAYAKARSATWGMFIVSETGVISAQRLFWQMKITGSCQVEARFTPSGAKRTWLWIGSRPCAIACGHHASAHMYTPGSGLPGKQMHSLEGWAATGSPKKADARTA